MAQRICTATDCERAARSRGLCPTHYWRLRKFGKLTLPTPEDRFWAKVDKTETCWLWTANRSESGYGKNVPFTSETAYAHRIAYELVVGPIPEGLQLDHLCRVRHCVNPAHLEPVTPQENTRRGLLTMRQLLKTHCPKGHPYDEANTYITRKGHRYCRACGRISSGLRRQRAMKANR